MTAAAASPDAYPALHKGVMAPFEDVVPYTTGSDANADAPDLTDGVCSGFYCSVDMTLKITTPAGGVRTIAVAAHVVYPIRVRRLWTSGSTFNSGSFYAGYN